MKENGTFVQKTAYRSLSGETGESREDSSFCLDGSPLETEKMDELSLIGLEYFTLLEYLAGYVRTEGGREAVLALRPLNDADAVRTELSRVTEGRILIDEGNNPPLDELEEMEPLFVRASVEGSLLEGSELLAVLHLIRMSERLLSFAIAHADRARLLREEATGITMLPTLRSALENSLDSHGEVTDNASPRLAKLRREVGGQKQRVGEGLNTILRNPLLRNAWQDTVVTFRNDRYVVPVKSNERHSVPGIIHDFSGSRATCFIEPVQIVELNNELSMLISEEREEVERILRKLTGLVRAAVAQLRANLDVITRLDTIFARAAMSRTLRAVAPDIVEDRVELFGAVHPLLFFRTRKNKERAPIPVDIRFPDNVSTIIISGANMGGKTVTLKTLGLLALMVQTGMHVPVEEGSRTRIFSSIHAVIGDEQDLAADLSTFSSQIRHILDILQRAGKGSLVLLDEICTNTDPTEGGALALALLDRFSEQGVLTMATTHYNTLKMYGVMRETAINVSVEFDAETHSPTYRLTYGSPGQSNAMEISRKLGMPDDVLERAQEYLSPEERKTLEMVQDMESAYNSLQDEREKTSRLNRSMEEARDEYHRLARKLEEEKEAVLSEERSRARRALRNAESRFRLALRDLRRKVPEEAREQEPVVKREFQETRKALVQELAPASVPAPRMERKEHAITVGSRVRIMGSRNVGTVLNLEDEGRKAEVLMGGLKISTSTDRLESAGRDPAPRPAASHFINVDYGEKFNEVNLVGLSVEDALEKVEKVIDQAVLNGRHRVELVHGVGTGALRRAIKERLEDHALVASFTHPDARHGGIGVTSVELKG